MKKYRPIHNDQSLTYFPNYSDGKVVFTLLITGILIFVATGICIILFDASGTSTVPMLTIIFALLVLSCALLIIIYRNMMDEFTLTHDAVWFKNIRKKVEIKIRWENLSSISFHQDAWYGRKTCRLHLKADCPLPNGKCYYIIPVNNVNEQDFLKFIPAHLCSNDPLYNWFS